MLIKNDNIELEFSLPEHMTDVGIRISGGLDSAIILYILCIYITETNRDIKILPMTTNDWTKPYQVKWATRVLNWMQNQFPDITFYEHKTYQLKENEDYIQGQIDHKLRVLKEFEQLNNKKIDVTLPERSFVRGKIHPVSQTIDEISSIFSEIGFSVEEGPDVENEYNNFTALNTPDNHPARDMHDTFYLEENKKLLIL